MDIGSLIRRFREENSVSQRAFAQMCGVSNGYISMLEDGKNPKTGDAIVPSLKTCEKIASAMGVPVGDLLESIGGSFIAAKRVPVIGRISCGVPVFASEEYESFVPVGDGIDADFCLHAKGDSMTGARILDGDTVFIKQCDEVQNGEIAAVVIGDEATLKRVYYYKDKKKLVLSPENPKYEPLVFVGDELLDIHILGKAVAFISGIK